MYRLGRRIWNYYSSLSLVKQISLGLIIGIFLALGAPKATFVTIFGDLFVGALKALAPLLVFVIVMESLSHKSEGNTPSNIRKVLVLYVVSMLLASLSAVFITMYFSPTLVLQGTHDTHLAPSHLSAVLRTMLVSCIENPIEAITKANYIAILFWAIIFGITARNTAETTHLMLHDLLEMVSKVIAGIIRFAPVGVMGLIFAAITSNGLASLLVYGKLILVLVGIMLTVAFVLNPLLVYLTIRRNPFPLVWTCIRDSGLTAFFTRSSAANIPVNMAICKRMKLDPATYSVSIPLGSTINMCGAAITITTLTLATVATMHIQVSVSSAIFMCILATVSACGSSGVAGGSLLLVPLACSMFGIPSNISMQVVGTGFIIGVIQDSCETALNSSSDLLFTAAADIANRQANANETNEPVAAE